MDSKADSRDYFRTPDLISVFLVPFGLLLMTAAALDPKQVPYDLLGPIGTVTRYVVNNHPQVLMGIFYGAWAIHVLEAVYALKLCRDKNIGSGTSIMWTIQTFIYGVFSLKHLLAYKPKTK